MASEQEQAVVVGKGGYEYISSYEEIVNHTVERCARLAEELLSDISSYPSDPELGAEIAAALRKIKDEH